jgi:hypothetical protein
MKRTEWLQETRKMRFEDVYGGWRERSLTQEEAARILGVTDRTFRRYVERYEDSGLEGLEGKKREKRREKRGQIYFKIFILSSKINLSPFFLISFPEKAVTGRTGNKPG